jgi:DNA repair protein RadD
MLNDRYYQTEAVDSIWSYFRDGGTGNPIVAMPTGVGKSVVIARFLQSVYQVYPNQRVIMLVDSMDLIQQNYERLLMAWPFAPAGVYSAGLKRKEVGKPITFAGIQSVWRLAALFGHIDLILIDEVHMVPPKDMGMYRTFIAGLLAINPNLKLVGLTATKYRMGQGQITDPIEDRGGNVIEPLFTDVCHDCTTVEAFNRFIAEGYLMPLRAKNVKPLLEADGVHMRGGEFIESELQDFVDAHDELTFQALKEARDIAEQEGRRNWLVFSTGNRHADTIGGMLDELGVRNGVTHSGYSTDHHKAVLAAARAGQITATVNNNKLTKGYDNPLIDMIVVLRQIGSVVNWVQILGRGTRPLFAPGFDLDTLGGRLQAIAAGGKRDCRVLDYGGNTRRLGPINDPVVPRRKGKGGGDAPVKCCDRCDEWIHASLRECPWCGNTFTFETKLKADASTVELVRGDDPIVETFAVDHVSVEEHRKQGMPSSMRLTYYSGMRDKFSDYIMPEHVGGNGFARRKSEQLWREMGGGDLPATTAEALQAAGRLTMPTHLRVWVNKQYPEILGKGRCYDGTAFGTQEPTAPPEVEVARQRAPIAPLASNWDDMDDDVPF